MSLDRAEVIIAGAGVIGLAVARTLSMAGREVIVVEAERNIGSGVSSRNSEVIHAGLYYPPDSLKARLCVEGREQLYRYCAQRGIAHRRLGKLVVATEEKQRSRLEAIRANAQACGVHDLELLSAEEACALEPRLHCVAALLSPSTGIIDSHALLLALQGDAEAHGARVAFSTSVLSGRVRDDGIEIELLDHGAQTPFRMMADIFVNAVGLGAPDLSRKFEGLSPRFIPNAAYARGCYFSLKGRSPFSRLIYPVPVEGGLGVHLTLDLSGAARFGPDVEWISNVDYSVDPRRAEAFYGHIRRYWPELENGALEPAYAGVRPKISGPGEPNADFRIDGPRAHGVPGLVNLFGIESPGLTASLAIADYVTSALDAQR